MQLLLAILLYLRVIVAPGTYTEKHINTQVEQNRQQIEAVQQDKLLMEKIEAEYIPRTDGIIIIQSETD